LSLDIISNYYKQNNKFTKIQETAGASSSLPQTDAYFAIKAGLQKSREGVIMSAKVSTRTGADSLDQAGTADMKQNAGSKIRLVQLDRNSAAADGKDASGVRGGFGTAVSRAEPALSPMRDSSPIRRSLSGIAEAQDRVIEAFLRDTWPSAAQPVPYRGLLEALRLATPELSSEKEDIAASQKLAERFACQPAQAPVPAVLQKARPVRHYITAAAFMILVTAGSAVYFTGPRAVSKQAPDGIAAQLLALIPSQPTAGQDGGQAAAAVSPAEEEALLKKGMILLKNGDVSAARLNFESLALRGSTKGAFALAQSFDPAVLQSIPIEGLRPDLTKAKEWYAKAAALGGQEPQSGC
jgi:hypothetical protein